jgi:hypothetical protein
MAKFVWVGVPTAARAEIKKRLRPEAGREWLILSEKSREIRARNYIRNTAWAFNTQFIASHARCDLDNAAQAALGEAQRALCESANALVHGLVRSFREFADEAISADGYAHFLNTYDEREHEFKIGDNWFFAYRTE